MGEDEDVLGPVEAAVEQVVAAVEAAVVAEEDAAAARWLEVAAAADVLRGRAEQVRDAAVRSGVDAGATWQQVGTAFGVTKQAAWERWGR